MRLAGILTLCLVPIVFAACTMRMREPSDSERETLAALALGLTREVIAAAEQVNVEAAFRYHSNLPDAVFLVDGRRYTRGELLEAYQGIYAGVESQQIDFGEPVVTVVSEKTVIIASTGRFITKLKSGGSFARDAVWTYVWVHEGEAWNIRHAHQSFPRTE